MIFLVIFNDFWLLFWVKYIFDNKVFVVYKLIYFGVEDFDSVLEFIVLFKFLIICV